jgi:hypothetical protein
VRIAQIAPVALSVALPGCGHIAAGRPARGILIFFLFGFSIDGWFYAHAQSILPPGSAPLTPPAIRYASLAFGALLWAFALIDATSLVLRRRRVAARAGVAEAHLRDALVASLRGDHRAALQALLAARRINDQDPDVLFHLGVVHAKLGAARKARRALHQCIRYDHDGKWDSQAQEHLRALESAPAPSPPHESPQGRPS